MLSSHEKIILKITDGYCSGRYFKLLGNRILRTNINALLAFFAIFFTMFSFDLLMSLLPTWYSTIFGLYVFAGSIQATMAVQHGRLSADEDRLDPRRLKAAEKASHHALRADP